MTAVPQGPSLLFATPSATTPSSPERCRTKLTKFQAFFIANFARLAYSGLRLDPGNLRQCHTGAAFCGDA